MSRGRARKTIELLSAARRILQEIQPASVRAVCYKLFSEGLISTMSKSATNGVSRQLTLARERGEIPWKWVVDETREIESASLWADSDQIIRAAVNTFRRDSWQDQPRRIELWSEKGTVRGTLAPVLEEFGVPFRVMHGYSSATVINAIAEESQACGKDFVALYVGDWDPSGKHMSDVDLPGRLRRYGAEVSVRRVALLDFDLENLPSFGSGSKTADPRYRWFVENVGTKCYELDAMAPPDLRDRVRQAIFAEIDQERWAHAALLERVEAESMREFYKSWQATKCADSP